MSDFARYRVVFVAGDPGGANALAPVIEQLNEEKNISTSAIAYDQAVTVFRQAGIDFVELPGDTTAKEIFTMLAGVRPDLVVTATSVNAFELEKDFIAAGKSLGVRTCSVLDFWSAYAQRFSWSEGDLAFLPDKIAVMDELAVSEMAAEGFPADRLVVTGQPAFDRLDEIRQHFTSSDKKITRDRLEIAQDSKFVLFISQPFAELFGKDSSNPRYPGYTQQSTFRELLAGLEDLAEKNSSPIVLGIMPHLRETENWWAGAQSDQVQIRVLAKQDFEASALSSDLVAGMTSTKLVEAALMGCAALSLQLGAEKSKRFDMERLGIAKMIFEKSALANFLEGSLLALDELALRTGLAQSGQAAANVRSLVEEMLKMAAEEKHKSLCRDS